MRLLITNYSGDPGDPGTWSGTPFHLMEALRRQGVTVFGCRSRPHLGLRLLNGVILRSMGFTAHYARSPLHRRYASRVAQRAASRHGCEVVLHTSTRDVPPFRDGLRHWLYLDSVWSDWSRSSTTASGISPRQHRMAEAMERSALNRVDQIFTIGAHLVPRLQEAYGVACERTHAVGAGCSARFYEGRKDYTRRKILCIAKERHADKGVPRLVEAFRLARQTDSGIELTIIGGAAIAGELPDTAGLSLTGRVSREDLERAFVDACLYAMPAFYEPWGLVYLEALAHRTPVLGFDAHALPEITENGKFGFLVTDRSPQELAKVLLDALHDPDRLARMGALGQASVRDRFTWERVACDLLEIGVR